MLLLRIEKSGCQCIVESIKAKSLLREKEIENQTAGKGIPEHNEVRTLIKGCDDKGSEEEQPPRWSKRRRHESQEQSNGKKGAQTLGVEINAHKALVGTACGDHAGNRFSNKLEIEPKAAIFHIKFIQFDTIGVAGIAASGYLP